MNGKTLTTLLACCTLAGISVLAKATTAPISDPAESVHTFGYYTVPSQPYGGLAADNKGNLYGTTMYGGSHKDGTVYKLDPLGDFTVLYNFTAQNDGAIPYGTLTIDASGNLYGTTYTAGSGGSGTVFELSPTAGGPYTFQALYSFDGSVGANPYSGVVLDAQGDIFGTTYNGGGNQLGTVYKLQKSASGYMPIDLYDFTGNQDGANPEGGLCIDAAGDLFGTAYYGGSSDAGTLYELIPHQPHYDFTTLHQFNFSDGAYPYVQPTLDAQGNLYGTTYSGGSHYYGTVYEYSTSTAAFTTLHNFDNQDGATPTGGVVVLPSGILVGTTNQGGKYGAGTVWNMVPSSITPGAWQFNSLYSFTSSNGDGNSPTATLVRSNNGNLFGVTEYGGAGKGMVFRVGPYTQLLSPNQAPINNGGKGPLTLSLTGNGYASNSIVMWGSTPLATTVLSSTSIQAVLPPSYIAGQTAMPITVYDPNITNNSNNKVFLAGYVRLLMTPFSASRNPDGTLTIHCAISNLGTISASSIVMTGGSLIAGGKQFLPMSYLFTGGSLAPGASTTLSITFPASAPSHVLGRVLVHLGFNQGGFQGTEFCFLP